MAPVPREGAQFGWAVAMNGKTAMVGAFSDTVAPPLVQQGAVYVYEQQAGSLVYTQQLVASDAADNDTFGNAIALQGDVAVIGATEKVEDGAWGSGAAYVFAEIDGQWVEVQKLQPPAPEFQLKFGVAVAISGSTIAVSSHTTNRVYLYERQGQDLVWNLDTIIDDQQGTAGTWGLSLALDGDDLLVGAPTRNVSGNTMHGAVYVYHRTGSTWSLAQELLPSDSNATDIFYFGQSVALDGDRALVGARLAPGTGPTANPGAAYVFERTGGLWAEVQKINTQLTDGQFGNWVSLQGDTAAIGAPYATVGSHGWQGKVEVYSRSANGQWELDAQLEASDGVSNMQFGWMVALDGDRILSGAVRDNAGAFYGGSAYFYGKKKDAYTISDIVVAGSGEIIANDGVLVADGATPSFTLQPDNGYAVDTVGGTCGGALSGSIYTTEPVHLDCTVEVSFVVTDGDDDVIFQNGFEPHSATHQPVFHH